jgi:hypothetical protein
MENIRLIKAFRGYRAGQVIQVTPDLAKVLGESGVAVPDRQTVLPQISERAVAPGPQAAETR